MIKRRSERVLLDVPLFISGETEDGRAFREETFTLTVSGHGALVILTNESGAGAESGADEPEELGRA